MEGLELKMPLGADSGSSARNMKGGWLGGRRMRLLGLTGRQDQVK